MIGPRAQSRGHKDNVFNNLDIVIGILTSLCCHKTPYDNIVFKFKLFKTLFYLPLIVMVGD